METVLLIPQTTLPFVVDVSGTAPESEEGPRADFTPRRNCSHAHGESIIAAFTLFCKFFR